MEYAYRGRVEREESDCERHHFFSSQIIFKAKGDKLDIQEAYTILLKPEAGNLTGRKSLNNSDRFEGSLTVCNFNIKVF